MSEEILLVKVPGFGQRVLRDENKVACEFRGNIVLVNRILSEIMFGETLFPKKSCSGGGDTGSCRCWIRQVPLLIIKLQLPLISLMVGSIQSTCSI